MEADAGEAEAVEPPPTKKSDKGIWIIVPVCVIPILVFVLLEVLSPSRVHSGRKIMAAQMVVAEFKAPLRNYQLHIGSYPDNNQGLQALLVAPSDLADPNMWKGPYWIAEIPTDPWSNPLYYERLAPNECRVFSGGPDGQPGTADDIVAEYRGSF